MFNKTRMFVAGAICASALLGCFCPIPTPAEQSICSYYEDTSIICDYPNLIRDPRQWAEDNLHELEFNSYDSNSSTETVDIDHDGSDELLIFGDGGQNKPCVVFKKVGQYFRYIGDLGWCFHCKVLPLGNDGKPRIATFFHCSANETIISILRNDGRNFETLFSSMVYSHNGYNENLVTRRAMIKSYCRRGYYPQAASYELLLSKRHSHTQGRSHLLRR